MVHERTGGAVISAVDHLVYAVPDLAEGIATIERLLGRDVVPGGRHEGWGTRNALVSLGEACYLEIIGPDPESTIAGDPVLFGIDTLDSPCLVTWAAKADGLDTAMERVSSAGIDLGGVFPGSRQLPDGSTLSWQLTNPFADRAGGVVPFLIDWGISRHPASQLPASCELVNLALSHPDPSLVEGALSAMDIPVVVEVGPSLIAATIRTPNGDVHLT